MNKAQTLRESLKSKDVLLVMGCHDALGAKLIERNQFDAVWASGFEIATSHGVPDANILTMKENLDTAMTIHSATRLPVICDCDTGYGNAVNVMHMVKKYEAAGMAAVVIEDKCFPKVNSFIPGKQELASISEFVGKLEAAREARMSSDGIMIFARIEALIAGWGMEEALKRARAYYQAGADGLVIHSKSKTPDEIFTFAKIWKQETGGACPLVSIPTTYSTVTAQELSQAGFKIVIYANQGIRASVHAMSEVFQKIRSTGSTACIEQNISSMQELFQLQGMVTYQEQEKLYSRKGEKVTAVIPAAADHQFQPDLAEHLVDKPLCMLEIGSKPLLERQLDLFRSVDISDFVVITGYRNDRIQTPGLKKIHNDEYKTKGSAHSLMCGLEDVKGKTLICYSDIIFDRQILESLLRSPHPITLVIDRSYRTLPRRDKALDLVLVRDPENDADIRKIRLSQYQLLKNIGKKISSSTAQHEFIGMILLNDEGLDIFKNNWKQILQNYSSKPFCEAPSAQKASVTDLLQFIINTGIDVHGLVVEHGWSEIYSLSDYQRVNHYFQNVSQTGKPSSSVAVV